MAVVSAKITYNSGQEVTLNKGTGDVWSATFPAPSKSSGSNNAGQGPDIGADAQGKGYYPVKVTVEDDAGNVVEIDETDPTWGTILQLKVLEKTKPTVAFTYPTQDAFITNAKPTFTWNVNDSGSGINPAAVFIKIDEGSAQAVTPVMSGATGTASYTPAEALGEGSHTAVIYATDYDGNSSDEVSVTFTVDTVAPVLNVTSPTDSLHTNQAKLTVTGTTNDATSSPVTVKITVGQTQYSPDVVDGAFSQEVTLSEGSNTITVTATDSAGKATTVTRTVVLDTSGPSITNIVLTPNPADGGATVTIQVTITDE